VYVCVCCPHAGGWSLRRRSVASKVLGAPGPDSGVSWSKRGVRMLYTVPRHTGGGMDADSDPSAPQREEFFPPLNSWTCSLCLFKFNPSHVPAPPATEGDGIVSLRVDTGSGTGSTGGGGGGGGATQTVPPPTRPGSRAGVVPNRACVHCSGSIDVCGPPAQRDRVAPAGCWLCLTCKFAGNAVSKEAACQVRDATLTFSGSDELLP
jgi:hypothetical protein